MIWRAKGLATKGYSGARGFGARRKPTAKQLAALAKGRRILAQKRKHKK